MKLLAQTIGPEPLDAWLCACGAVLAPLEYHRFTGPECVTCAPLPGAAAMEQRWVERAETQLPHGPLFEAARARWRDALADLEGGLRQPQDIDMRLVIR